MSDRSSNSGGWALTRQGQTTAVLSAAIDQRLGSAELNPLIAGLPPQDRQRLRDTVRGLPQNDERVAALQIALGIPALSDSRGVVPDGLGQGGDITQPQEQQRPFERTVGTRAPTRSSSSDRSH